MPSLQQLLLNKDFCRKLTNSDKKNLDDPIQGIYWFVGQEKNTLYVSQLIKVNEFSGSIVVDSFLDNKIIQLNIIRMNDLALSLIPKGWINGKEIFEISECTYKNSRSRIVWEPRS